MSSSTGSTNDRHSNHSKGHCCGSWSNGGKWSGVNIAAMVLGFILFWPIGLFILFWIMSGRSVKQLPEKMRETWRSFTGWGDNTKRASSDNVVFNEYQQTQFDRIREIKEEIKERGKRFSDFRADAKRRADEEEFNRFMSSAPSAES